MLKIKRTPLTLASLALFGLITSCGEGVSDDNSS